MIFVGIDRIKEGDVLGQKIFNENNKVLLNSGTVLSSNLISKLKMLGFKALYISNELTKEIELEETIPRELELETIENLRNFSSADERNNPLSETINLASQIVDSIYYKKDLSLDIYDIRNSKNYSQKHSLKVCEYAIMVGREMGLNKEELNELAMSALLHDIGKNCRDEKLLESIKISNIIKNKVHFENNEYMEKMHPVYSYAMVEKLGPTSVSAKTKIGILCHHENEDGTGYPMRLKSEDIHLFAKIIHVCDAYDNAIFKDINNDMTDPLVALKSISKMSGIYYDPNVVETFKKYIPIYPKGIKVQLSNGMLGYVFSNNKNYPTEPVVLLENGKKIDLKDSLGIRIDRLVEELNENKKTK